MFWLLSKMQETPEVQEVSKYNPVSRVVLFHWLVACVLCITQSSYGHIEPRPDDTVLMFRL